MARIDPGNPRLLGFSVHTKPVERKPRTILYEVRLSDRDGIQVCGETHRNLLSAARCWRRQHPYSPCYVSRLGGEPLSAEEVDELKSILVTE